MALSEQILESLEQQVPPPDGRIATLFSAAAALPLYNEYAMAEDAEQSLVSGLPGVSHAIRRKLAEHIRPPASVRMADSPGTRH